MTANATPPAPDNYNNRCQDLATVNHLGHVEFEPGAYLADGAEYLSHVACKLGTANYMRQLDCREVSMLYPSSHQGGPTATKKIPIGGLVLQLCSSIRLPSSDVFDTVQLHVGIPSRVYETLCKAVTKAGSSLIRDRDPWDPSVSPHDGHHWMTLTVAKHLQGAVYADGQRRSVAVVQMLKRSKKSLKCDAFVKLSVVEGPSTGWKWRLQLSIIDVLITDTTTAEARSCRGREVVGRRAFSSPEVVAAAGGLQISQAEGQPKKRRLS